MKKPTVDHPELPGLVICRLQHVGDGNYKPVPVNLSQSGTGETWVSSRRAAEILGLPWRESKTPGKSNGGCESLRRLRCSTRNGEPVLRHRRPLPRKVEYELQSLLDHKKNSEVPGYWDTIVWCGW